MRATAGSGMSFVSSMTGMGLTDQRLISGII